MPPMIYHHKNSSHLRMKPGMVFTIEPIFTMKNTNQLQDAYKRRFMDKT